MLEKPVTPTYAEAKELDALAKSHGVILSAFQNRRWDSDFLTVKKLIDEGKVRDAFSIPIYTNVALISRVAGRCNRV